MGINELIAAAEQAERVIRGEWGEDAPEAIDLRTALASVSLPNHANQLAELIGRVHTFADQLLAWGYKDIAHQVLTEILIGPVVTDDTYATLQETRADLQQAVREIDDLRNALEAQSRTVVHQRRSLEEAEEELGRGELLHALAAIGRGLNEGRT